MDAYSFAQTHSRHNKAPKMPRPSKSSSTVTPLPEQLPIWPQDVRGMSNALARSALFNVANARKGERANLKRVAIASLQGTTITYTGEELRQDDEDVFLQILHVGRMHPLGTHVQFTANSLLRELGWTSNTSSYRRLVDCLDRLKASSVAVTVQLNDGGRRGYTGSLIRSFRWREDSDGAPLRHWEILLEREIVALFGPDSYSRIDWELRLSLPPLAKWLHSFYVTHAQPFPYKVETLYKLTGSEIAQLRQFRYKLKQALALLVERGFLVKASIDPRTDLVNVERSRNRRHLALEAA